MTDKFCYLKKCKFFGEMIKKHKKFFVKISTDWAEFCNESGWNCWLGSGKYYFPNQIGGKEAQSCYLFSGGGSLFFNSEDLIISYLWTRVRVWRPCTPTGCPIPTSLPAPASLTSKLIHCKENPIYVFLFWELRGLSPNQFYLPEAPSPPMTPYPPPPTHCIHA